LLLWKAEVALQTSMVLYILRRRATHKWSSDLRALNINILSCATSGHNLSRCHCPICIERIATRELCTVKLYVSGELKLQVSTMRPLKLKRRGSLWSSSNTPHMSSRSAYVSKSAVMRIIFAAGRTTVISSYMIRSCPMAA
jgi:hypothetical protein